MVRSSISCRFAVVHLPLPPCTEQRGSINKLSLPIKILFNNALQVIPSVPDTPRVCALEGLSMCVLAVAAVTDVLCPFFLSAVLH